jgi:hypothetical protein
MIELTPVRGYVEQLEVKALAVLDRVDFARKRTRVF